MAEPSVAASNAAEITVSELSGALKRTLEDRFGFVRVRGEVSGYRGAHASGHVYFCLKDASARLDAVIWKQTFQRMRIKPEEGLEVIASGRITTFAGKSSYQIVVESVEPAGVGALMALLEARRKALEAEGLFESGRKRALPYLPRVIGVVTSPTGAVIRDILHRLSDRFPVRVLVWPVRVQGETAAAEVARAIAGFNAFAPGGALPRPDVLIVARGGGSLEDLWGFNEEIVVRAAATSQIPLIAAVGHETDWTLIDHAADVRAPTPTAAAEMSVPVRVDLIARLADLDARLTGATVRGHRRRRDDVRALARALPGPDQLLAPGRQQLDAAASALRSNAKAGFDARRLKLAHLSRGLARHSPRAEVARARERQRGLSQRMERAGTELTRRFRQALDRAAQDHARAARRGAERRAEQWRALLRRLRGATGAQERRMAELAARAPRLEARLDRALADFLRARRSRYAKAAQVFAAVNYRNVLARGYALVFEGEALVRSASETRPGQAVQIQFADGKVAAVTAGAPGVKPQRRKTKDETQASLF